jgi:hypothetical protein
MKWRLVMLLTTLLGFNYVPRVLWRCGLWVGVVGVKKPRKWVADGDGNLKHQVLQAWRYVTGETALRLVVGVLETRPASVSVVKDNATWRDMTLFRLR